MQTTHQLQSTQGTTRNKFAPLENQVRYVIDGRVLPQMRQDPPEVGHSRL